MAPLMFSRITCMKVQGYSVLYVNRVKGFKKGDIWYKISWRKCLEVTSTLGSNPPLPNS